MQEQTGQSGGTTGARSAGRGPAGGAADRTGVPGVESALGRNRAADGELPSNLGSNRAGSTPGADAMAGLAPPMDSSPGVADQARRVAGEVADQAQQATGKVMDQVKQQTSMRLSGQISQASEALGAVSDAVLAIGRQLRENEQGTVAGYTDQLAEQVERAATFLRDKDLDQLVDETERFARRQPMVFLGGAFTLGLLAARFLKSSSQAAQPPVDRYSAARSATPFHLQSTAPGGRPSYAYDMPTPPPPPAPPTPLRPQSGFTGTTGTTGTTGGAGIGGGTGTTGIGGIGTGGIGTTGTTARPGTPAGTPGAVGGLTADPTRLGQTT